MAVQDPKVAKFAAFPRQFFDFSNGSVPINQAAVLFGALVPGQQLTGPSQPLPYGFKGYLVENVQVFARGVAATAQVDVQIAGVSILTGLITPVAGSTVQGALVSGVSGRLIGPTQALQVKYTTNGTGTLTDVMVVVTVRPFPLDGEA